MFEDLERVYNKFKEAGSDNPFNETLKLFNFLYDGSIAKMDLTSLKTHNIEFDELLEKRIKGVPIEYIFRYANFMGRKFFVSNDTLIPTPETELLVTTAVEKIKIRQTLNPEQIIIDMGTGSGNVALSIALETENTLIFPTDISQEAVEILKKNIKKFNLNKRVKANCGDLFEPFNSDEYLKKVDIIVCNPPYMPTKSLEKLPKEVINHEPILAFDAGPFGVDFFIRLFKESHKYLKEDGWVLTEIGIGQDRFVNRIINKSGQYNKIEYFKLDGEVRVISAKCKE